MPNNNKNNNTVIMTTTMFMVLSRPKSLREFTQFIWWMQIECLVAGNPQTKPINLDCESAIATVIITQPIRWCSFYHPMKGGRLSRHCSKNVLPVPKAAYRSGHHDKHNRLQCDSNLGPLTPQSDAITTRLLRPAKEYREQCADKMPQHY